VSVDSVVYTNLTTDVAQTTVVFQRLEIRQTVNLHNWTMSRQIEIYPGQYVCLVVVVIRDIWMSLLYYIKYCFDSFKIMLHTAELNAVCC